MRKRLPQGTADIPKCPECGASVPFGISCTKCGLEFGERPLYPNQRGSQTNRKYTRAEWAFDQKELLKTLREWGIVTTNEVKDLSPIDLCTFVNHSGERCKEKATPKSRALQMCVVHKKEWRKRQVKEAVRRFRAK